MVDLERVGYAPSAERAVLASILADHAAIVDVSEIVTPRSFTDPASREVYAAMLACWEQRTPPDFISVDAQLSAMSARHADVTTLSGLLAMPPSMDWNPAYATSYARTVANAERMRIIQAGYVRLMDTVAGNPEVDPGEALAGILADVDAAGSISAGPVGMDVAVPELFAAIDDTIAGHRPPPIPTGLRELDRAIGGGIRRGELVILAARPSMGKTAAALWAAMSAATEGPAIFFSLEMDRLSVMQRLLAAVAFTPFADIDSPDITQRDRDRLAAWAKQIHEESQLFIDDSGALTVAQIMVRCQRQKARGGLDLVVVDYLELVGDEHDSEEQRLTRISRKLKQMAKDLNCGVVLLSQLNRKVEDRTPPIPHMKDLRYSGSLEAIADKIILLYRQDYYADRGQLKIADQDPALRGIAQFRIEKFRNGKPSIAQMVYRDEYMRFDSPSYAVPPSQLDMDAIDTTGRIHAD